MSLEDMNMPSKGLRLKRFDISHKILMAVCFGLAGCILNIPAIALRIDSYTVYFLIGLIAPMLIAQRWGWVYGLISVTVGYTMFNSWIPEHPGRYWPLLNTAMITLWIAWHGFCAGIYSRTKKMPANPYIAEIPFRLLWILISYTVGIRIIQPSSVPLDNLLIHLRPDTGFIHFYTLVQTLNAYFILLLAQLLTYTKTMRKLLRLDTDETYSPVNRIIGTTVGIGLSFWVIDGLLDYFLFYRGIGNLTGFLTGSEYPHEFYVRMIFFIACLAGGLILAGIFRTSIQKEKQFADSLKIFHEITENTSDIIAILDTEYRYTYITSSITAIAGYAPNELIGTKLKNFIHPEDYQLIQETLDCASAKNSGSFKLDHFRAVHKNSKTIIWMEGRITSLLCEPAVNGILLNCRDITIQRQAQEKLEQSEKKYRSMMENLSEGIWMIDSTAKTVYANKAMSGMLGYSADEMTGRYLYEFMDAKQAVNYKENLKDQKKDVQKTYDLVFLRKDGSPILTRMTAKPVYNEKNNYAGTLAIVTDLTEWKESQQRIRYIAKFPEENPNPVMRVSLDGVVLYSNKSSEPVLKILCADKENRVTDSWKKIIKESADSMSITKMEIKCGDRFFLIYIKPIENEHYVNFYGYDITDRIEVSESLKKSELKYRELFDNIRDGTVIVDMSGNIIECNTEYGRMLGYTTDELKKMSYLDITPAKWHAFEKNILDSQTIRRGYSDLYQKEYIKKDGTVFPVELRAYLVRDFADNPTGMWAIVRDITERQTAVEQRERLLRTLESKNDELESIVYISSHDLRSPLVNINGFTTEIENLIDKASRLIDNSSITESIVSELKNLFTLEIPPALRYIQASAGKMDSLLVGLTKLSRLGQASLSIQFIDMNHMFASIVDSLRFQIKEASAKVTIENMPNCYGDPLQISQVFVNIIDNALKYRDPNRKQLIKIKGETKNAFSIYCISDTGIGINPDHHKKVFEIFHRLNPSHSSQGDGLGLTIVRRIVEKHGGKIWLESKVGSGTSFFVALHNEK
ncbi:MAG: PAS domain S-box protein [Candidatus Auribacterota bacterium]|jgi:PAS domain S-box-containing protein|nr:PAS domain S-box protein [Candidatus Auribacterota bacterium]